MSISCRTPEAVPLIIPFFLMNRGCPHRCLFCNEKLTAGDRPQRIAAERFRETVRSHLASAGPDRGSKEIAFYGGTFTGMDRKEQNRLLELAAPFLREGKVGGIRISTRPDGIDGASLDALRRAGVTTVEVGAQSLHDGVLEAAQRGHSAADTVRALGLLKERGFKTGIHLMAGLPGDSPDRFAATIDRTIALRPDMVRLHPTLVLRDTPLAEACRRGDYLPLSLEEAVGLGKTALRAFCAAGIPVIRLGLQTTAELEKPGAVVAGPFHPAFRSLVEASLFRDMATTLLALVREQTGGPARFLLSPADVSHFSGPHRENVIFLKQRFGLEGIVVSADGAVPRHTLVLATGQGNLQTDFSGRIDAASLSR
jgi:histone acetyltransferase (RNA polymerase elongator complex component)